MRAQYKVDTDEVRALCIRRRYYTAGDNSAYGAMFDKCRDARTLADVVAIAEDIKEHSHADETAEEIAEDIANFCAYTEIVKEDETPRKVDPLPFVKNLFEIQHQSEELARTIARHNSDFICTECIRTISALLDIYETASNPEARAELREELEAITGTDLY